MANVFAEQSVIGSILIDSSCVPDLIEKLTPWDFQNIANQNIFRTVCEMSVRDEVIDAVTIEDALIKAERTVSNFRDYALELMQITPTAANVLEYARIVKESARQSRISDLVDRAADEARFGGDLATVSQNLSAALDAIQTDTRSPVTTSTNAVENFAKWLDSVKADPTCAVVRSGMKTLDKQLGGGFFRTGLYVIGARPGMGKTTVAVNLAECVSKSKKALFVSLEMDKTEVTAKRLAVMSGISYTALMTGRLSDEDERILPIAFRKVQSHNLDIIDEGVSSVADLSALLTARRGYDIVFVDYLGLLNPAPEDAQKSRYDQVSNISKELKALAKRTKTPIVALAQLNRETVSRKDKRPTMTDLRDSGAIEQDADGVILLHREGYYQDEKPEYEDIELIVAKNRHGSGGTVLFRWVASSGRIYELSERSAYY